jgi:hypothetical protein
MYLNKYLNGRAQTINHRYLHTGFPINAWVIQIKFLVRSTPSFVHESIQFKVLLTVINLSILQSYVSSIMYSIMSMIVCPSHHLPVRVTNNNRADIGSIRATSADT